MELDEQPKGSITLLIKRKWPGFSIREQLEAEQKTALLNSLRRMKNLQGEEKKVSPNQYAVVTQLVECQTENLMVARSIRACGTNIYIGE